MVDQPLLGRRGQHLHFTVTDEQKRQIDALQQELGYNTTDTMRYIIASFFTERDLRISQENMKPEHKDGEQS